MTRDHDTICGEFKAVIPFVIGCITNEEWGGGWRQ
jgi:hypothetical protein